MKTSGQAAIPVTIFKTHKPSSRHCFPRPPFLKFFMGPGEKFCNQALDTNLVATLGKAKNNLPRVQCRNIIHIFCRIFTNKRRFVFCKSNIAGTSTANSLFFSCFYTDLGTGFFEDPQGIFEASSTNCLPLTALFSSKSC